MSMLSVPIASLVLSILCFMVAVSAYCLQNMGTSIGRKALLGLEIGASVQATSRLVILFRVDVNNAKYGCGTCFCFNCESILIIVNMPVPWEALIPFGQPVSLHALSSLLTSLGLVTAMFGAAGTLLNVSKRAQNQGKASQAYLLSPYLFIYLVPHSSLRDTISTLGRRC
jgi:hypothetical protein